MYTVIHVPQFRLQAALRAEPDLRSRPAALADSELAKPVIVQANAAARARGVAPGLTASQAMARCADLIIKTPALDQERTATEILLQTAYAFAANIESTAPGICTMDLKGLGLANTADARALAEKILQSLQQLNFECRIGIAATPDLALLAARGGVHLDTTTKTSVPLHEKGASSPQPSPPLVEERGMKRRAEVDGFNARMLSGKSPHEPPNGKGASSPQPSPPHACGGEGDGMTRTQRGADPILAIEDSAEFIAALPIEALAPPPDILDILSRWGIRTAGEFFELGKNQIAERLGVEGSELFDRARADSTRPLRLVSPPERFLEQTEFESEIETIEPLLFILRRFVEQLSRRLEMIYLTAVEFQLRLGLSSGAACERVFKIPSPTNNVEIIFRMLQTHLETLRTDSPIVSLRLEAKPAKPNARQLGLFEPTLRNPNQFGETMGRLTGLVASENVGSPELEQTHKPDSFRMMPPNFDSATTTTAKSGASTVVICGLRLRRFRPPLPARFEFREEKPALIRSDVFSGALAAARGPYFGSGNWWEEGRWAREEWDVEIAGGALLRIFRSSDGCFVEGVYD